MAWHLRGRWPSSPPKRRGHVAPRPLGGCWPYKEAATWPGVRRRWGAARKWTRRRGGVAEKASRGRAGAEARAAVEGQASRIFYLLWCDSRHSALIGPARHVGPSSKEKNVHIFPPSGGYCGPAERSESPLISGLEKTGSDLFTFGSSPGKEAGGPLGAAGKRPTGLGTMAPAPLLRFLGFKFGVVFF